MESKHLPKYAIGNFFLIRKFYQWFPTVSFFVFGIASYLMEYYNNSMLLIAPLLCYLLCLCISVELAKFIFQFSDFNRKRSGSKRWIVWQIIINSVAVTFLFVLFVSC